MIEQLLKMVQIIDHFFSSHCWPQDYDEIVKELYCDIGGEG